MKICSSIIGLLMLAGLGAPLGRAVPPPSPFGVTATLAVSNGPPRIAFNFDVPPQHVLYSERLVFQTADGKILKPAVIPQPVLHRNELTGAEKLGYDRPFTAELELGGALPFEVTVKFQGCSNSACYFPERHVFRASAAGTVAQVEAAPPSSGSGDPAVASVVAGNGLPDTNGFRLAARETGFLPKKAFVAFLERSKTGEALPREASARFNELGPLASFFLIVLGGIGLNLTPCVLPLIPINLAIIGAGARASSRRRGFALGGVYGAGMALVYGVLGLIVVLTGAKFGTLNSSAWFNLGIALVFGVMALAMFDLVNVDFSRFQGRFGSAGGGQKGQFVLAFGMGVMAAMLAGACVAPVVISVLLLAAHLYGKGVAAGLLLPFLLGLGMAMPWPFAGAGLSFLPKPGCWMKWVKYSFGALILLFAAYYGHLAWNLLPAGNTFQVYARTVPKPAADTPERVLATALQQARLQGKPVLIDFAASWCKNCQAMDAAVFPANEVKAKLNEFVVVRYEAEKPNDSPAREVLDQFGVMGLPTYVVLLPDKK